MNPNDVLLSAKGGTLEFASADGEFLYEVAVPPGRVRVRDYFDLVPEGGAMRIAGGLSLVSPRVSGAIVTHDGHLSSGANPDYKPTSASQMELQMRAMVARMQAQEARLDRKMKALEKVERVPQAPVAAVEEEKLVE